MSQAKEEKLDYEEIIPVEVTNIIDAAKFHLRLQNS